MTAILTSFIRKIIVQFIQTIDFWLLHNHIKTCHIRHIITYYRMDLKFFSHNFSAMNSRNIWILAHKIEIIIDLKNETLMPIFKHCEIILEFEIATRGEIKSCIWLQRYDRENDQMVKNCSFFVLNVNLTFILSIFSSFIYFLICVAWHTKLTCLEHFLWC